MITKLEQFVSFAPPLIGPEEIQEVADTLLSGWLTTGPKTERFEKAVAAYVGADYAAPLSSCTAALHLALLAMNVGPGQGVITSPLTFASTGHVIFYVGAQPFFVDIEADTGNLCPYEVAVFLEKECERNRRGQLIHKATRQIITTIIPVHYGGHPVEMDKFIELAEKYNLNLLEDAAHSLGAKYKGLQVGALAKRTDGSIRPNHLCAFSFYATKNLTTGEGGMVVGHDNDLLEKIRVLGMYGLSDARRIWGRYAPKGSWVYDVAELGYKYNMMDIQASLGLHQLAKLDDFILKRAQNARIYDEAFQEIADLASGPVVKPQVEPAWHLYPLLINPERLSISRDDLIISLRDLNLGASVLFIPLHYHSLYKKRLSYKDGDFPRAENFFKRLINLPLSPAHNPETIKQAARLVADLLKSKTT